MELNEEHYSYGRLDIAFANFLTQRCLLADQPKELFQNILIRLSYQCSQGHSCILIDEDEKELVNTSGLADKNKLSPLINEENRLYLQRYWFYENRIAQQIMQRLGTVYCSDDLESRLSHYFDDVIDKIDWQREAAQKAATNAFIIITGGPGTGKTTTVVKILALLQEIAEQQGHFLHIALVAPTGKAAMRLQESIGSSKSQLPCTEQIKHHIPETVVTIHRLLGTQVFSPYFKHNAGNPLIYDLIVVDESSMIDIALMSKLVDALKPDARLILLGDKDQLASVESGSVLADLTAGLPDYTVTLQKSYRFSGVIKQLADAVNTQQSELAWQILQQKEQQQVSLLTEDLIIYCCKHYYEYLQLIKQQADIQAIFEAFNQFQVLCSNRLGEFGVNNINHQIEKRLESENKIQLNGQWYLGRPIMITQNYNAMQLFNGDIGLCLADESTDRLSIMFLRPDGSIKKVPPSRIPQHETTFAMTIHKSQGSEFSECVCVLADKMNPVLTKELVYTAITRAKKTLKIVASHEIFNQALQQRVERASGLKEKLIVNNLH